MYKGSRFSGPRKGSSDDGVITGPPSFVLPLKNCEVVEGSAARFQCQVTGNPEPDVEWYKDGKKLRESKQLTFLYDENDNCKLIITEGRHNDAGEYKVTASNPHGKVSCSAQLIIKDQAESAGEEASDSEISEVESEDEGETSIRQDKITSLYTVKEELGKGRFGVVCKCIRKKDGKEFAAKFIKCSSTQAQDDVKHEIEIMELIKHKTLLRLADAFETASEYILVMELVTGGELFEKIVEDEFISENDVIHYMKQIMEGVQHMHSRNVLHLDLKPENIMIVRPNSRTIKLIDFGLARKYNPKENLKVMFGTPEFVAPEVLTYDRITPATDVWSVGVIAYVLLSGLSPFMGDNDAETLVNVQTAEWDFDDPVFDDISEDAKDFISKVLVLKSSDRITVELSLKDPWLTETRERGKINTNRLKAFTARRKWKKALTAIRSTNFLSKLLGSRGTEDGNKPAASGGAGLLARVKAMHVAGVQAPESGPASSPFLSPSSAAAAAAAPKPTPEEKSTSSDPASTKTTSPAAKETTPTPPSTTPAEKTNGVPAKASDSKATPSKGVSSKAPESKSKVSNDVSSKTSDAKTAPSKDNSKKASESQTSSANDVSKTPSESKTDSNDISKKEVKSKSTASKTPSESKTDSNDISKKEVESKSTASKDSTSKEPESKESSAPSTTITNDTKKTPEPSASRTANKTPSRGAPPPKGKLPQWPPPPKERPQKRGK